MEKVKQKNEASTHLKNVQDAYFNENKQKGEKMNNKNNAMLYVTITATVSVKEANNVLTF